MLDRLRQLFLPSRKRGFDAAAGGTRWSSRHSFGPLGPAVLAAAGPVRSRARYQAANNGWAVSGVEALTTALIGSGIVPAPLHSDESARKLIGAAFTSWAATADADGLTDFYGIQASAARALVVDGEAFLHMPVGADGLKLRLIPAEMVDASYTVELGDGRRVIAGIEFDAAGTRVAYHVSEGLPTDLYATHSAPIRIPAQDIVHLFRPLGAGQVRGISWLAPILLRLGELDQLEDALLVGAKVAAMHAGFLTDLNGTSTNPYEGTQTGGIMDTGLEPGTLKVLPAGFDIKFSTPQQAQQTIEFAQLQLRAVAAGLGVPEHLLTGDLRGANYSSLRAGLVAFRQRVEQLQYHLIIPQMLRPIWLRALQVSALSGAYDFPGFDGEAEYFAAEWYPPAQPWVDPLKDIEAEALAVQKGFKSRRQVVAGLGYDIATLDAEIANDRGREAALGLDFNQTTIEKGTANG